MTHLYVEGINGQIEVDDEWLRIHRAGFIAHQGRGLSGLLGRGIQIHLSDIVEVAISYPRFGSSGYIRFLTGNEEPIGVLDAIKDESSVLFTKKDQEKFDDFREELKALLFQSRQVPIQIITTASVGEELSKVADLYQQGLLTDDEFKRAKDRLLAGHSEPQPTEVTTPRGKVARPDWAGTDGRCRKCGAIPTEGTDSCWYCGASA